ncbi:Spermidine hydroxycinnamoyl transferase [Abeliophyllum distichum]|uniref:Spermidine hydroxycinnamoyl transferase n=1 Tax=Abeliophyllum distichum TaxID=126358 RepID=A0ABD1SG17_9LAMI
MGKVLCILSTNGRRLCGAKTIIPPFVDRKVMERDEPLVSKFDSIVQRSLPSFIGEEDNMEQWKKPITVAFLNITKIQIEKLRNKASEDPTLEAENNCRYNGFEAVAAHIWLCIRKAQWHMTEQ